jgi:hypothetical protein
MLNESAVPRTPGACVEGQRLVAQIHHLNGQLMLTSATIQQQQTFIDQQLTGQVLISSIHQPSQPAATDEESLIGDLVSVTPYETHGVKFNWPKLLRWLRERFAERDPDQE